MHVFPLRYDLYFFLLTCYRRLPYCRSFQTIILTLKMLATSWRHSTCIVSTISYIYIIEETE